MVVSSVTPLMPGADLGEALGVARRGSPQQLEDHLLLLRAGRSRAGDGAGRLALEALVDQQGRVAAVVEEHVRAGLAVRGRAWASSAPASVHHQYSSSVSPFQAKTATPFGSSGVPSGPTTTAAAAWSCVEKMLQLAQRTSAPRATRVSISTAVCTVMWSEPVIRAPFSGCGVRELRAGRHQARHLVLGEANLLAAELGQAKVGDLEIEAGLGGGGGGGAHPVMVSWLGIGRGRLQPRAGPGLLPSYAAVEDPLHINGELSIPSARSSCARAAPRAGWPARQRHRLADRGGLRRRGLPHADGCPALPAAREARPPGDRGGPGRPQPGAQPRARPRAAAGEAGERRQGAEEATPDEARPRGARAPAGAEAPDLAAKARAPAPGDLRPLLRRR